jgi:hypothetical protein
MMINSQTALILFSFVFVLYVSPFAMSAFSNAKKNVLERTDLAPQSHRDCLSIGRSVAPRRCGTWATILMFLTRRATLFIVTLSEHVDGNFQARCGQRLQSTKSRRPEGNNSITIQPWLVALDERHCKVSTHLHSTTNQKKDMCWC